MNAAFRFGGIPFDLAEPGLRLFAKEVLPVLKSWRSETAPRPPRRLPNKAQKKQKTYQILVAPAAARVQCKRQDDGPGFPLSRE